jgi:hypothetical protein
MTIQYKRWHRYAKEPDWGHVSNEAVIHDFMTKNRDYRYATPGIEEQMDRLRLIVGMIADAANIDLSSLIDSHDLEHKYEVSNSTNTD